MTKSLPQILPLIFLWFLLMFSSICLSEEAVLSFDIAIGAEIDSNVSVNEIDQNTSEEDTASFVDLGFGIEKEFTETLSANITYDFSQSAYSEFSDFNLTLHTINGMISKTINDITGDINVAYAKSALDGQDFLTLTKISPSLSSFIGRRFYIRAGLDFTKKEFILNSERNADADGLLGSLFYFINGTRTYLSTTYTYSEEIAQNSEFDYYSDTIRLSIQHDITLWDRDWEFGFGYRMQKRYYANETQSINQRRKDTRQRISLEMEIPFGENYFLGFDFSYDDNQSNLQAAHYNQYLVTAQIGASF